MTEPSLDLSTTARVAAPEPAAERSRHRPHLSLRPRRSHSNRRRRSRQSRPVRPSRQSSSTPSRHASSTRWSSTLPRRGHVASTRTTRQFTTRVNDIAKLGDDDIRSSANVSNRLLDKPWPRCPKAASARPATCQKSLLVAAGHGRGPRSAEAGRPALAAQAPRHHPVRRPADRLLPTSTSPSQAPHQRDHRQPLRRPGRAAARQRRHRAGEGQPLDDDGPAAAVRLPGRAARHRPDRADRRRSRRPIRSGPRCSRTTCCSPSARSARTC